jgi:hypothetical protein
MSPLLHPAAITKLLFSHPAAKNKETAALASRSQESRNCSSCLPSAKKKQTHHLSTVTDSSSPFPADKNRYDLPCRQEQYDPNLVSLQLRITKIIIFPRRFFFSLPSAKNITIIFLHTSINEKTFR